MENGDASGASGDLQEAAATQTNSTEARWRANASRTSRRVRRLASGVCWKEHGGRRK